MFIAGFEIGIGIILALACVCAAPFLLAYVGGAVLGAIGRVIQAYESLEAVRYTVTQAKLVQPLV